MREQREEGVWQGGKSQPRGALQIIPASLSSEPLGGIFLRLTAPSLIKHFGTKVVMESEEGRKEKEPGEGFISM